MGAPFIDWTIQEVSPLVRLIRVGLDARQSNCMVWGKYVSETQWFCPTQYRVGIARNTTKLRQYKFDYIVLITKHVIKAGVLFSDQGVDIQVPLFGEFSSGHFVRAMKATPLNNEVGDRPDALYL